MPVNPGGSIVETRTYQYVSDGTSEPGDLLAIADGKVTAAEAEDDVVGVHAHGSELANDPDDEDVIGVVTQGITFANVEAGVVAGDVLGPSAVPGEADVGESDGKTLIAYSDFEDSYFERQAPDGTAAVEVS